MAHCGTTRSSRGLNLLAFCAMAFALMACLKTGRLPQGFVSATSGAAGNDLRSHRGFFKGLHAAPLVVPTVSSPASLDVMPLAFLAGMALAYATSRGTRLAPPCQWHLLRTKKRRRSRMFLAKFEGSSRKLPSQRPRRLARRSLRWTTGALLQETKWPFLPTACLQRPLVV